MHKIEVEYIKYDENMNPKDRRLHEHNVSYSLLKRMLWQYFSIENPVILKTENGKPYVENKGVYFSVSHTHGLAACAVANSPVGIDCEKILPRTKESILNFSDRFFVSNELAFMEGEGYSPLSFYKVWTGKEATIKKRGSNMSDLKNIDITKENLHFSFENDYIIAINI